VSDGSLLLGASSLSGRSWQGSVWVYSDPKLAPSEGYCKAGVQTDAGVTDARWVSERALLLASDAGKTHTTVHSCKANVHPAGGYLLYRILVWE